jgi:soluble lytic murein transglycosylase-like protein
MSVADVLARIEQLQGYIANPTGPRRTGAADPTAFASQLAAAAGTPASATAATAAAAQASRSPMALGAAGAAGGATGGSLPTGTPFKAEIEAAAARHNIDPALLAGLVRQESNFNPTAGSPAGARGLTQLMPGTARGLGVTDVTDPAQALEGGAKYLRQQLDAFGGDVTRALAAYNAGPGAVQRFGGVPPYAETQNYVRKVQGFAAEYRAGGGAASAASVAPAPTTSRPSEI